MKHYQTGELSLSRTNITDPVSVNFKGPFSIQPSVRSCENEDEVTYTLLVSIDGAAWHEFGERSTNVSIVDSLQINFNPFPWRYIKVVTNGFSSTGTVTFLFAYN